MVLKELYEDAANIAKKDPAAKNVLEIILLYPGFHILIYYRFSHWLHNLGLFFFARFVSELRTSFNRNRNSSRGQDR